MDPNSQRSVAGSSFISTGVMDLLLGFMLALPWSIALSVAFAGGFTYLTEVFGANFDS